MRDRATLQAIADDIAERIIKAGEQAVALDRIASKHGIGLLDEDEKYIVGRVFKACDEWNIDIQAWWNLSGRVRGISLRRTTTVITTVVLDDALRILRRARAI